MYSIKKKVSVNAEFGLDCLDCLASLVYLDWMNCMTYLPS